VKGDFHSWDVSSVIGNRLKPDTLTEWMSINLCNTGYEDFDPSSKATMAWLRSGKLRRRLTKPYGPRPKKVEAAWDSDEEENCIVIFINYLYISLSNLLNI